MWGEQHEEYRQSMHQLGMDNIKNAYYDEALKNWQ